MLGVVLVPAQVGVPVLLVILLLPLDPDSRLFRLTTVRRLPRLVLIRIRFVRFVRFVPFVCLVRFVAGDLRVGRAVVLRQRQRRVSHRRRVVTALSEADESRRVCEVVRGRKAWQGEVVENERGEGERNDEEGGRSAAAALRES